MLHCGVVMTLILHVGMSPLADITNLQQVTATQDEKRGVSIAMGASQKSHASEHGAVELASLDLAANLGKAARIINYLTSQVQGLEREKEKDVEKFRRQSERDNGVRAQMEVEALTWEQEATIVLDIITSNSLGLNVIQNTALWIHDKLFSGPVCPHCPLSWYSECNVEVHSEDCMQWGSLNSLQTQAFTNTKMIYYVCQGSNSLECPQST